MSQRRLESTFNARGVQNGRVYTIHVWGNYIPTPSLDPNAPRMIRERLPQLETACGKSVLSEGGRMLVVDGHSMITLDIPTDPRELNANGEFDEDDDA